MRRLQDFSIKRKLQLITMIPVGAALLFAYVAFAVYDLATFREKMKQDLSGNGAFMAFSAATSLAFNDQDEAAETLSFLRIHDNIVAGCFFTSDGSLFAQYTREANEEGLIPASPGAVGSRYGGSYLVNFTPVTVGGERIGTVFLRSDLRALDDRLTNYVLVGLGVLAAASLLAYLLAARFQRMISSPILRLVESAKDVSENKDYSIRAVRSGDDELGVLVSQFNEMLTQIQQRDRDLQEANDEVRARVKTLQEEVAERKRAEEALQMTQFSVDHAADTAFWIMPDARLAYANEAACRTLGYSRDELLKMTVHDIDSNFTPEIWPSHWQDIKTRRSFVVESCHRRKDGGLIPVEVTVNYLEFKGREYNFAFARDITERKRAEEEIGSVARFPGENPSPVLRLDVDGVILYANKASQPLLEFWQCQRGQPLPEPWRALALKALTTGQPQDGEIACCGRVFSLTFAPISEAGYVNLYGHDITERKRAEEERWRLAMAVEQADELMVITDITGIIEYINPAFERLTGYARAEAIGKDFQTFESTERTEPFYQEVWASLVRGETWAGQVTQRKKDGSFYEAEATVSPLRNAGGQVTNYLAVLRDVTHEVELEARLRQAQKLEAIGTLAGGIAHDFNNILAPILGYTELAIDDAELDSDTRANLNEVLHAANRAKALVEQILMFSRQAEIERKPVEVCLIVKEALRLLRASIPTTIDIVENLDAAAGNILADPTQIHQMIVNLCTNAYQAMGNHTGVIEICLNLVSGDEALRAGHPGLQAGPGYIRLTVADTGHGMDKPTQERIFDPFFTTKEQGKGTGLGLATVHGIVADLGGDITVSSEEGQGTTFCVHLPRFDAEATAPPPEMPDIAKGNGERILLVDDEQLVLELGRHLLTRLAYDVTALGESEQALDVFRAAPDQFDLVMSDQTMPKMTGAELAAELLNIRPDIPIIITTGFSEVLTPASAKALGVEQVLQKPFSRVAISEAIRNALASRRAR